MPEYEVEPGVGVGKLKFGMSRNDVRRTLGKPDEAVKWTPEAKDATDIFKKPGINVHYDEEYMLAMAEFVGEAHPTYDGDDLTRLDDVGAWLEDHDDEADINPPDYTSEKLNISFYIPHDGQYSVGIFRPGYYD